DHVFKEMAAKLEAPPKIPVPDGLPEATPLFNLRRYSNYLAPRLGLLSGDSIALAGTYVRNLLLNWLILIPALSVPLALPKWILPWMQLATDSLMKQCLAAAALVLALVFATYCVLSVARSNQWSQKRFL